MDDSEKGPRGGILVGVQPGLPDAVLHEAARLARDLHVDLVCAHVDLERYTVGEHLDGSVLTRSIDPDLPDEREGGFDSNLAAHIDEVLAGSGVAWVGRELAGDPGHALGRLAETVDARYIVVGTREATMRETLREFFQGSVASHLAHRQHRPVLVVPLRPVADGEPLPWE
ncbi:universal stress protein [Microbacterium elymi]|uniref:Universal stress protein n=1 Tax=Microbacterium elymi TaxID=2909587 RepID=A0ABY5NM96_9MICO|nr:universal stress protein [Microbacterium elymi]UUT36319.1 universal stress protein [Microbacterium elymi]